MSSTTASPPKQTELKPSDPKLLALPSKIPRPPKKLPYIDLSIPGTPVSSRYVIAWKAQQERERPERLKYSTHSSVGLPVCSSSEQANSKTTTAITLKFNEEQTINTTPKTEQSQIKEDHRSPSKKPIESNADPFEAFLQSIDKLKSDRLKNVDSKDILDLFLKLENAARARDEIDNDDNDDGYRSVVDRKTSNLNMFSLSFLRRRSSNQDIGGSYFYSPTLFSEYRRKSREISTNGNDEMPVMKHFRSLRRSVSNLERFKEKRGN